MISSTIKQLDNYQLLEIINNKTIDNNICRIATIEFNSRNISPEEKARLKLKSSKIREEIVKKSNGRNWNPLFTPFLMKTHFNQLAKLKGAGYKKEAREYERKFNVGTLIMYSLLLIGVVILFS